MSLSAQSVSLLPHARLGCYNLVTATCSSYHVHHTASLRRVALWLPVQ